MEVTVACAGASSKQLQEARQGPVNLPDLPSLRIHGDDDKMHVWFERFSYSAVLL